jgi:hypothetical protein
MDLAAEDVIFAAPFPSEHLRRADGRLGLATFPNPSGVPLMEAARRLVEAGADGFGRTSPILFAGTAPLGARVAPPPLPEAAPDPTVLDTLDADAAVVPLDGDPTPARIRVARLDDGGPFGAPNLLVLLPEQGRPLRAGTRYAAFVRRSLGDEAGAPLGVSAVMAALAAGDPPETLTPAAAEAYRAAVERLATLGVDPEALAGLAVFTTGDPSAPLRGWLEAARTQDPPALEGPVTLREVFDGFCVYTSTVTFADYQEGRPPFETEGGAIQLDDAGRPIVQRRARARLVLTVPRAPMPPGGFPLVVFARTGGGGDRPLVDRGPRRAAGAPDVPGTGPARELAVMGLAGLSVDGPNGGPLRNPSGGDEQFLVINVTNPAALRDNLRQSALELALALDVAATLSPSAAGCPGLVATSGAARLDLTRPALMGHSMGATIAPLALAIEPRFAGAVLAGAGASWIENIVYKRSPLPVAGVAELLIGYTALGRRVSSFDPAVGLVQWAGEAADPPVYGDALRAGATHVLVFQGIDDSYIPPPVANPLHLTFDAALAAPALDDDYLAQRGGAPVPLPYQPTDGAPLRLVVPHAEDGIEDGHEVMYQLDGPKLQYRCFLADVAAGRPPRVVPGDAPGCDAP